MPTAVTDAVAVMPAVTMAVTDPRAADHGTSRAADNRSDWAGDNRAGGSTDRRTGYRSFSTVGRVRGKGQGGECRDTRGQQKFAHRILHNSICGKTRKQAQSSSRQEIVQANET
jgi:hypothetical protein